MKPVWTTVASFVNWGAMEEFMALLLLIMIIGCVICGFIMYWPPKKGTE